MPNKVKRPMNAYMLFSKEKRADIIQQNPELKSKVAEIAKLIGNHWKEMTSEEKYKYVKMAEENKQIYESETPKLLFNWFTNCNFKHNGIMRQFIYRCFILKKIKR